MHSLLLALACTVAQDASPQAVLPAASARIRTEGGPTSSGWNLWSNGTVGDWFRIEAAGAVTVTVRAAGQAALGEWPRARLEAGTAAGSEFEVEGGEYRDIAFELELPAGPCPITVAFLNDHLSEGQDRNLLLAELRVSGASLLAEPPTVDELTRDAIRAHRTGTLVIETAPGAEVRVTQLRHEFSFGTALASHLFDDRVAPETREAYLQIVRQNFNAAVTENALKWPQMEPRQGRPDWRVVDAIASFCQDNDLRLRGHCLFWAAEQRVPAWARELSDRELRGAVERRLEAVLPRYRGRIQEYDVNNEMIGHDFFARRLGSGIRVEMFRRAHRLDPEAPLYVNDYGILGGARLAAFEAQIEELIEAGAPVGGIGCQGHFRGGLPPTHRIGRALDRLARFGLPVAITEYDLDTPDEAARARGLDAFFRTCFAHPAVRGIWMWGFWEGAHWRPEAALWRRDFSPTLAALAYRDLVFGEWWTRWEGRADDSGRCELRAFFGAHRVEAQGRSAEVWLERETPREVVKIGG